MWQGSLPPQLISTQKKFRIWWIIREFNQGKYMWIACSLLQCRRCWRCPTVGRCFSRARYSNACHAETMGYFVTFTAQCMLSSIDREIMVYISYTATSLGRLLFPTPKLPSLCLLLWYHWWLSVAQKIKRQSALYPNARTMKDEEGVHERNRGWMIKGFNWYSKVEITRGERGKSLQQRKGRKKPHTERKQTLSLSHSRGHSLSLSPHITKWKTSFSLFTLSMYRGYMYNTDDYRRDNRDRYERN